MIPGHNVDVGALLSGGPSLEVEDEVPVESFEGLRFERPAHVRLEIRYVNGWLEVDGAVDARAEGDCDICLDPVGFDVHGDVDERFDPRGDRDSDPFGEANVVSGGRFDVGDLSRQVLLSTLPMGVRCPRHSEGT
ncbi:MAG: YceD family protein [Candidatus Tyrphobacter sp.]